MKTKKQTLGSVVFPLQERFKFDIIFISGSSIAIDTVNLIEPLDNLLTELKKSKFNVIVTTDGESVLIFK